MVCKEASNLARNKYPEETVKKILDVSLKLFFEKGYEHTTVQDIIDNLDGLSKGAIYHHFKSKEDIFVAATEYLFSQDDTDAWAEIRDNPDLTAIQKFQQLFVSTIKNPQEEFFRHLGVKQTNVPQFLIARMKRTVEVIAPKYIKPIIEQGIAEGTVKTDFPEETAEVLMLLLNIWLDPGTYPVSTEKLIRKFFFILDIAEKYGVKDWVNEEMISMAMDESRKYMDSFD